MTIADIIHRLTTKGGRFEGLIWVGENYSKADLLRDLRGLRLDVADITRELVELRKAVAAGPVMPEVPSDAVVHVAFASADIPPEDIDDEARGRFDVFWRDIRAALLKERGRE